nr:tyrosine-type recombinase/integrase [Heliobacterium chlorum]
MKNFRKPFSTRRRRISSRWTNSRSRFIVNRLFSRRKKSFRSFASVQCIVKKYAKLTGIEHLTCHTLRHTFAHELTIRKIPMDVIARLMGHMKSDGSPNLSMTSRYTMPGEDDLARAVEELSWV